MSHIYALCKRQLQHPVPISNRFVDDLQRELTSIIGKFIKLQELELNREARVLHFKSARDLLVGNKFVDHSIETMYISFGISGLISPAAMPLRFKFQHLRPHPLLHYFSVDIGPEKQVDR